MIGATRYVEWSGAGEVGERAAGEEGAGVECRRGWKQRGEAVRAFYGVINLVLSLNYKTELHIKM